MKTRTLSINQFIEEGYKWTAIVVIPGPKDVILIHTLGHSALEVHWGMKPGFEGPTVVQHAQKGPVGPRKSRELKKLPDLLGTDEAEKKISESFDGMAAGDLSGFVVIVSPGEDDSLRINGIVDFPNPLVLGFMDPNYDSK